MISLKQFLISMLVAWALATTIQVVMQGARINRLEQTVQDMRMATD